MTFPLPGANWTYLHSPRLVATTGPAGFALVNGTPTILSWTAPNDGIPHRALLYFSAGISSTITGGQVQFISIVNGQSGWAVVLAGGNGTGNWPNGTSSAGAPIIVDPGTTVTLLQASPVTAGAGKVFAEIWAS